MGGPLKLWAHIFCFLSVFPPVFNNNLLLFYSSMKFQRLVTNGIDSRNNMLEKKRTTAVTQKKSGIHPKTNIERWQPRV